MLKRLTLHCFYPVTIPMIILKKNPPRQCRVGIILPHQKLPAKYKDFCE